MTASFIFTRPKAVLGAIGAVLVDMSARVSTTPEPVQGYSFLKFAVRFRGKYFLLCGEAKPTHSGDTCRPERAAKTTLPVKAVTITWQAKAACWVNWFTLTTATANIYHGQKVLQFLSELNSANGKRQTAGQFRPKSGRLIRMADNARCDECFDRTVEP